MAGRRSRPGAGTRLSAVTSDPDAPGDAEPRWVVLYDAGCGFCTWLLSGLLRWDRARRLEPIALQRPDARNLLSDLTLAQRAASWHLISPDGERRSGGAALSPLLRLLPGGQVPAAAFARFPWLTDRGYRWVAEHRAPLSGLMPTRVKQRVRERLRTSDPPH